MQVNEKGQTVIEVSRWEWENDSHLIGTIENETGKRVVDSYRSEDVQVLILE